MRLVWRTGTLLTCAICSTGLKYQSNPHHLSSLQEHGLLVLAPSSCIFRELFSIAAFTGSNGIALWKFSKWSRSVPFLKTSIWNKPLNFFSYQKENITKKNQTKTPNCKPEDHLAWEAHLHVPAGGMKPWDYYSTFYLPHVAGGNTDLAWNTVPGCGGRVQVCFITFPVSGWLWCSIWARSDSLGRCDAGSLCSAGVFPASEMGALTFAAFLLLFCLLSRLCWSFSAVSSWIFYIVSPTFASWH